MKKMLFLIINFEGNRIILHLGETEMRANVKNDISASGT